MEELAEWLKQFQKPLLVCHNGRAFDYIILLKNCMKISCSWPLEGFVDSFFLKKLFQVGNVTNCKPWLRAICVSFDAHSALEDVETLQSLVLHLQTS